MAFDICDNFSVKILDCQSYNSTLQSLSSIVGIEPDLLESKLDGFACDNNLEDLRTCLWRTLVGEPREFDGVYWFHVTRTPTPSLFCELGILPLDKIIGELKTFIDRLKRDDDLTCPPSVGSRSASFQYGLKTNDRTHWGPYAILIREAAFCAKEMNCHDYLSAPEIVEDYCNRIHPDVLARFQAITTPCIVKFLDGNQREDVLPAALMYLWAKVNGESLWTDCNTCFDGNGVSVSPERITRIEIEPKRDDVF